MTKYIGTDRLLFIKHFFAVYTDLYKWTTYGLENLLQRFFEDISCSRMSSSGTCSHENSLNSKLHIHSISYVDYIFHQNSFCKIEFLLKTVADQFQRICTVLDFRLIKYDFSATTCNIVCIRHTGSRAVALSHLDGSNTKEAIGSMIMSIQAMTHAKDDQLGSLCIHIIGGYLDEGGYSRGKYGFLKISHFLEGILMKHIDTRNSLDS